MPLLEAQPDAVAHVYARSLFELAESKGGQELIERVVGELEDVLELARSDALFNEFLASRTLPASIRAQSIERMFRGRLHDLTVNFLQVLNDKGRLAHLVPIVAALDASAQEHFGRVEVDIHTASPVSGEELRTIREMLSRAIGRDTIVHPYTDESMIGGVRIRIGDRLIDASLSSQLRRLRDRLLESGVAQVRSRAERAIEGEAWSESLRPAKREEAASDVRIAEEHAPVEVGELPSAPDRSRTPNRTGKKSVDEIDVRGKRVLIRVDFNVPLDNGRITDDRRIRAAVPTIRSVIDRGGRAILMSHLGRPEGTGYEPSYSLQPCAEHLSRLLGVPVAFPSQSCIDERAAAAVNAMKDGQVLLLENLRFHKGEKNGDEHFARKLAALGDAYVNDAFGTCHRTDASMVALPRVMAGRPRAIGFLVERELWALQGVIQSPAEPFVVVLGGAKVADKIGAIENLLPKCQSMLIGGAMAYTFLAALGRRVGESRVESDRIADAKRMIDLAAELEADLYLPSDHVCSTVFAETGGHVKVCDEHIDDGYMGLDIGPRTQTTYAGVIATAKTVVWNGPMGVFEWPPFRVGTQQVARAMADATARGATTIVGGGDSAAAVERFGLADRFTHVSTGGGASVEMLEGKPFRALDEIDRQ